jgi:xanthine dehydrogenase accessory factor
MDSIDLEVLRSAAAAVAAGRRCELVTVVKTWGSSPRPAGSMLALCASDEGVQVTGSVSGGCIEDDLIERARSASVWRTTPELLSYGISAGQAHRFGLPCGGTIELAVEPLSGASGIAQLLERVARRELVARRLDLASGAVTLARAEAGTVVHIAHNVLTTLHGPSWRLIIIGAGPLSRFLAQVASAMDYQVTVCDPREEYRAGWTLDTVELVREMPDDVVIAARPDHRSAIVALTHDPKLDDLALMEALKSDAFYVGAIGSRANNARRRERLLQFDLDQAQLARLHGPVGMHIGSKTPAEIAISILAHMTAIRNGVQVDAALPHGGAGLHACGA